MSVCITNVNVRRQGFAFCYKVQLSAFLYGQDILPEKGSFFARVGVSSPFPMFFVAQKTCIFKCRYTPIAFSFYCTPAMVEMEVSRVEDGKNVSMKGVLGKESN